VTGNGPGATPSAFDHSGQNQHYSSPYISDPVLGGQLSLTISGGAITIEPNFAAPVLFVSLFGEGGAADDLDNINGGRVGQIVILRAGSDTVTITVRGVGNLYTNGPAASFALDSFADTIAFVRSPSSPNGWLALTPGSNNAT